MYTDEEMLMLSGIQHYAFCPRQWALIHIEQLWADNRLTVEGNILHSTVDDPLYTRKTNDIVTLRSVSLVSKKLGLYGFSDAIELHKTNNKINAIKHPDYAGYWEPHPIEYKHGKAKSDEIDEVQLTAQIMCLEEMYNIQIDYGWLYYGEIRHRKTIEITSNLRAITKQYSEEMHKMFQQEKTPKAILKKHCKRCSLSDLCMPEMIERQSVEQYLKKQFNA